MNWNDWFDFDFDEEKQKKISLITDIILGVLCVLFCINDFIQLKAIQGFFDGCLAIVMFVIYFKRKSDD